MPEVRVRFTPGDATVMVAPGTTLHEAAAEAGVTLPAPCGGLGTCGSCRVIARGGLREPDQTERDALGVSIARGFRLACRARVEGPADVQVEQRASGGALRAQVEGPAPDIVVEPPHARGLSLTPGVRPLGAAVDIGTTTIAVRLHDLEAGRIVGTAASLNPQTAWGHDVLTRVSRALAGEAIDLRRAVTVEVERLISSLLDRPSAADGSLLDVAVVGNPVMTRLYRGADLTPFADAATVSAPLGALQTDTIAADMPSLGAASLLVGPEASPFIGSDAVTGAMAAGLEGRLDPAVLVDLGTNSEVILFAGGKTFAASAAAGSAFEGYGLSDGMRAEPGAIERAWLEDGRFEVGTVEDEPPAGICGSGLLDLLALLFATGAMDRGGRLVPEGLLAARVHDTDEGRRFEVVPGVVLTQQDIRQAQLAKGAVRVALDVVLDAAGLDASAIGEVLVSGGFGSHLRPDALATIGMFPVDWAEKVTLAGNTALAGASMLLLSTSARRAAELLASEIETVPLAQREDFQRRFIAALDLAP